MARPTPRTAYETIRYEVADAVATIALDQPDTRNALSDQLLDDLAARSRPRATIPRRGSSCSPPRTTGLFSAGGSLGGFAADVPLVQKHFGTDRFPRLFRLMGELGKPTPCAANGHVRRRVGVPARGHD